MKFSHARYMYVFLGKSSNSFSGKRVNNSLQTSGKLESKKRASLSPKINANGMITKVLLIYFFVQIITKSLWNPTI